MYHDDSALEEKVEIQKQGLVSQRSFTEVVRVNLLPQEQVKARKVGFLYANQHHRLIEWSTRCDLKVASREHMTMKGCKYFISEMEPYFPNQVFPCVPEAKIQTDETSKTLPHIQCVIEHL